MPARTTIAYPGECYHIFNRGALRMTLFFNSSMYHVFLRFLTLFAERCKITIITMCLMPNHFHLLVRVEPGGTVDQFMQRLCSLYSKTVNRYLKRVGTIYEGRYQIRHVKTNNYFLALCRYIHLNPVRAALVEHPGQWEFSNYLECLGLRDMIPCDKEFVASMFGSSKHYEAFVLGGTTSGPIDDSDLAIDLAEMRAV